ncbi:MAG: adenylate cyclase [Thermoleophilaceae bacterium]|jgi:class 3 adenylate cyclase|nr:adenylate cyclase [Thermoleophilaceae bacterium]
MRRCHTFLFADLVGFTAFTESFGDEAAADVAVRFTEAAARLAQDHGACLVKCLGDGVMLRGGDAGPTVQLGLRMQSELAGVDGLPPIHAGAHTGCAVERGGDWYGAAVNLAARVANSARGGELLLTEATVAAAGQMHDVELEGLGPQLFRNVAEPTPVYSVRRAIAPERAWLHGREGHHGDPALGPPRLVPLGAV